MEAQRKASVRHGPRTDGGTKANLFVAIDRTSKFAVAQLLEKANRKTAWEVLEHLLNAVPYHIHTILADVVPKQVTHQEFQSWSVMRVVQSGNQGLRETQFFWCGWIVVEGFPGHAAGAGQFAFVLIAEADRRLSKSDIIAPRAIE